MATKYKRIQARIERNKERRKNIKNKIICNYNNYNNLFTFQHYVSALRKCNKNVGYKLSTQEFNMNAIEKIHPLKINYQIPIFWYSAKRHKAKLQCYLFANVNILVSKRCKD